jgi:hypothetical protein
MGEAQAALGLHHCEETWRSYYVPVFPEHIVGKDASEAGPNEIAS